LLLVSIEKEADEFNMLATTSTLAVIALFDALSIAVMQLTGFSKEQFAIIHPSGAVGDRLLRSN
jgi:D-arabinose 5-phosphate isomerase GutQ